MTELEKSPVFFGLSPDKLENPFENQEAVAAAVLDYLAERGGSRTSGDVEVSDDEIARELYERFGVYDTDFVYQYWDSLKKTPSAIQNPTLQAIAEKAAADEGFDHSFVTSTIMFVDTAWVPIRERLAALATISNVQERKSLLEELRADIGMILQVRKYSLYQHRGQRKTLEISDLDYDSHPSVSSSFDATVNMWDVVQGLQRAKFGILFEESLGLVDKDKLQADTLRYGAKGANLEELSRIKKAAQEFGFFAYFEVPEYRLIPTSVYDTHKAGGKIIPDIEEIYKWAANRKVIVRSSAVYSEDAEQVTGAGIYESIVLEPGASLRQFLRTVKDVYKSVDSEGAKKYREQNGIPEEKMGIVVQEFMDAASDDRGYINSILKNVPALMEIVYADGLRPLIIKERAYDTMIHGDAGGSIFHYQVDIRRKSPNDIKDMALLATLLEKHYGQPIQIEFAGSQSGSIPNIVQARFLPKNFSEERHVEFPEGDSLFEGRAVGVFDVTLPVLPSNEINEDREGAVIFESSHFFTLGHYGADESIPKSGGVIVLQSPKADGGHIETICAEKGLALICADDEPQLHDLGSEIMLIQMGVKRGVQVRRNNLGGYKTLRMVSDGLKGKVYGIGEKVSE